ncbi:MAG: hypothetical protein Q3988_02530 [Gemella sp.]|nr:hypothetical protein [Gemella sp.]
MEFNLNAVEIYEKEFTRSKKDKEFYSIQEVNDFLDLIIEDYQKIEKVMEKVSLLEEENKALKEEISRLNGVEISPEDTKKEAVKEEQYLVNSAVGLVAADNVVRDEVITQQSVNLETKELEVDTTPEIIEDSLNETTVVENSIEEKEVELESIVEVDAEAEENTAIIPVLESSEIKEESNIILEETALEESNKIPTEDVVESLTLDDIAEIRRLLQEERAALYNRNEE